MGDFYILIQFLGLEYYLFRVIIIKYLKFMYLVKEFLVKFVGFSFKYLIVKLFKRTLVLLDQGEYFVKDID